MAHSVPNLLELATGIVPIGRDEVVVLGPSIGDDGRPPRLGSSLGDDANLGPSIGDDGQTIGLGPSIGDDATPGLAAQEAGTLGPSIGDDFSTEVWARASGTT